MTIYVMRVFVQTVVHESSLLDTPFSSSVRRGRAFSFAYAPEFNLRTSAMTGFMRIYVNLRRFM